MATTTFGQDVTQAGGSIVPTVPAQNVGNNQGSYIPSPSVPSSISSNSLTQTPSLNIPPPPQDNTNYGGMLASIPTIFSQAYAPTQADQQSTDYQNALSTLYGSITGKGGSVGQNGQIDTSGALPGVLDTAATSLGYKGNSDLLNQLNDVNNQIQGLQKEAAAIPLQLEQNSVGRMRTEGGIAPIQAGQLRENAIKALSASAIAQTLQGNVARAQDMASKAVDAQFKPYQAQLNYLQNLYALNKDTLDRQDKRRSDQLQATLADRTRILNNQREDYKTGLAAIADAVANNPGNQQAALAAQQAQNLDPTSPDYLLQVYSLVKPFASDLAARTLEQKVKQGQLDLQQAQISQIPLENQLKSAQIAQTNAQTRKIQSETITPTDSNVASWAQAVRNGQATLQQVPASIQNAVAAQLTAPGQPQVSQDTLNARNQVINLANTLLQAPSNQFARVFGLNLPVIPGTAPALLKNQIDQLQSMVALSNRAQLKGSGAISDFEARTLEKAGSSIGTNLSPKDAREALMQLRGSLTTLNGGSAPVLVTDSKGNSQTVNANSQQINAMIKDGLTIKYQ